MRLRRERLRNLVLNKGKRQKSTGPEASADVRNLILKVFVPGCTASSTLSPALDHVATSKPCIEYIPTIISTWLTDGLASMDRSIDTCLPNENDQPLPASEGETLARQTLSICSRGSAWLDKSTTLGEESVIGEIVCYYRFNFTDRSNAAGIKEESLRTKF